MREGDDLAFGGDEKVVEQRVVQVVKMLRQTVIRVVEVRGPLADPVVHTGLS